MTQQYLESVKKRFHEYKTMGEKAMAQLGDDAHLFWHYNEESNSIATIVKHMAGNMLSRWTDFLTTDGEKEWRNRDIEFENDVQNRAELLAIWNKGWNCVFAALEQIDDTNITSTVYIRKEPHTVVDAVNRQLAHYASHVGQIIFIVKMLTNDEWQTLTIPRKKNNQ
jgi:Protein of unknown function (DUF1572)